VFTDFHFQIYDREQSDGVDDLAARLIRRMIQPDEYTRPHISEVLSSIDDLDRYSSKIYFWIFFSHFSLIVKFCILGPVSSPEVEPVRLPFGSSGVFTNYISITEGTLKILEEAHNETIRRKRVARDEKRQKRKAEKDAKRKQMQMEETKKCALNINQVN